MYTITFVYLYREYTKSYYEEKKTYLPRARLLGATSCLGLGDIGMVMVWADEEESLLKVFILRPQISCSSSESSMFIISGVGAAGCIDFGGCIGV